MCIVHTCAKLLDGFLLWKGRRQRLVQIFVHIQFWPNYTGGHRSGAKRRKEFLCSCPSTFLALKTITRFGERFCDGKYSLVSLLPDKRDPSVTDRLRHPRNFETLKSRTAKFQNSLIPYSLTHFL